MAVYRIGSGVFGAVMVVALTGCLNGGDVGDGGSAGLRLAGGGTAAVERDVEAPEVFHRAERALWDGRPSLGGVWVAHPDVRDPERVIIRNPQTGREVIGALFRRERQNPGPAFQVSSDAATALGMIAGAPAELRVTAMRTEQVRAPAQTPVDAPATPDTAPAAAPDAAIAALSVAALAAVSDAAPGQPSDLAPDQIDIAAAEPQRARRGWPFGRRADQEPIDALAGVPLGDADPALVADQSPQLAAGIGAAAVAAIAPPVGAPALERAFIQLGIFSVEDNANRALRMARDAGLEARSIVGQGGANRFWRVTVGPAASVAERDRMLATVRRLGFTDAYAIAR